MLLQKCIVLIEIFVTFVSCIRHEDLIVPESRQSSFFPSDSDDQPNYPPSSLDYDKYRPEQLSGYETNSPNRQENFRFSNDLRDTFNDRENELIQPKPISFDQKFYQSKPQPSNFAFNQGEYYPGSNTNYLNSIDNNNGIYQQQNPHYQQLNPSNYAQFYNYQTGVNRPPSTNTQQRPYRIKQYPQQFRPGPPQYPYYQSDSPQYYPSGIQQTYANDYNNYQSDSGNPLTNFISNLSEGATNLFSTLTGQTSTPGRPQYDYPSGSPADGFGFSGLPPNGFGRPPGLGDFGGGGGNAPPLSPPGPIGQFGKAVEEITRNDDFQCIPKVICQMVGGQRRQNTLPSFLASPIFSALIAAVPSTSAGLVYGRAALLGYTSGEHSCDGAYPKCPRNEDDLLYYLNNHRGGFFRLFNGGAAFGDDVNYQYNPNPQKYRPPTSAPSASTALGNLGALQSLADAINQGGGINLSNLGANTGLLSNLASLVGNGQNLGSIGGGGGSGSGGINEFFGNLLTGFIGNRFSSRRLHKRSLNDSDYVVAKSDTKNLIYVTIPPNESVNETLSIVTLNDPEQVISGNATKTDEKRHTDKKLEDDVMDIQDGSEEVAEVKDNSYLIEFIQKFNGTIPDAEARIVNARKLIYSDDDGESSGQNDPTSYVIFPKESSDSELVRVGKNVNSIIKIDKQVVDNLVKFPDKLNDNFIFRIDDNQRQQQLNNNDIFRISSGLSASQYNPDIKLSNRPEGQRMIFPDRTGTGNLKFDNNIFYANSIYDTGSSNTNLESNRFGKILTGHKNQYNQIDDKYSSDNSIEQNNYNKYYNNYNNYNNQQPNRYSQLYFANQNDRYQQQEQQPIRYQLPIANYYHQNNYQQTTNYPVNSNNKYEDISQNVYVTNSKGIVEYYINSAGKKIYV